MEMNETKGLLMVHTGNGKGKTTAAIGLAVRAWGQGLHVLILQFIKGKWKYGELKALAKFSPQLEIRQMGQGFTQKTADAAAFGLHQAAAREALQRAKAELQSGLWDLVILDEINYAVKFGLLNLADVIEIIEAKPQGVHLLLTGRDARPEIIARADLVTEMCAVKHPYEHGIKAQQGIEF